MKKSTIVIIHLIFWGAMLSTFIIQPLIYRYMSTEDFYPIFFYVRILDPVAFYIGYFVAFFILKNKRLVTFVLLGVVALYGTFFIVSKQLFATALVGNYLLTFLVTGVIFRFFINWFSGRKAQIALQRESLKSELLLLRNQVNPHFLFNTLNNIDSLIKKNPQTASDSLIKVSDMMRYMLYDSSSEKVKLKDEINYLANYISLEKLRSVNPDHIQLTVSGEADGITIAPMLFIPFIENAFKHSPETDVKNRILVTLEAQSDRIHFSCRNNISPVLSDKDETPGIGLPTVQRRLALIYPGKHELSVTKNDNQYHVDLTIDPE